MTVKTPNAAGTIFAFYNASNCLFCQQSSLNKPTKLKSCNVLWGIASSEIYTHKHVKDSSEKQQ